jgi:hypothetical protein
MQSSQHRDTTLAYVEAAGFALHVPYRHPLGLPRQVQFDIKYDVISVTNQLFSVQHDQNMSNATLTFFISLIRST